MGVVVGTHLVDESRLQQLALLRVLDTEREERFDRIVRIAQRTFGVPTVLLSFLDEHRQVVKAAAGSDLTVIPRQTSLCHHTVTRAEPVVVPDLTRDAQYADNPYVAVPGGVRFYAGEPLSTARGACVGSLCLLDHRPRVLDDEERRLLRDLADLAEEQLAFTDELRRAGDVQRALLPTIEPRVPGYEVAGGCQPATAVGGDFYDWFPEHGGLRFSVADVMGKGLPAALLAAGVRTLLRVHRADPDLAETVRRVEDEIGRDLEETGAFVTLFTARLDPARHEVAYVDAGHGTAVVVTATGGFRRLDVGGGPLGAGFGRYDAGTVPLDPGDTLVVLSDGLLDLVDSLEQAAADLVTAVRRPGGVRVLVRRLTAYAASRAATDDVTVLAVRRLETAGEGILPAQRPEA